MHFVAGFWSTNRAEMCPFWELGNCLCIWDQLLNKLKGTNAIWFLCDTKTYNTHQEDAKKINFAFSTEVLMQPNLASTFLHFYQTVSTFEQFKGV